MANKISLFKLQLNANKALTENRYSLNATVSQIKSGNIAAVNQFLKNAGFSKNSVTVKLIVENWTLAGKSFTKVENKLARVFKRNNAEFTVIKSKFSIFEVLTVIRSIAENSENNG